MKMQSGREEYGSNVKAVLKIDVIERWDVCRKCGRKAPISPSRPGIL